MIYVDWNVGIENELQKSIGVLSVARHVCGYFGDPNLQPPSRAS